MSWTSPESILNLLSTKSFDLLISWFKLSIATAICSLCSLIVATNELEAAVISSTCPSVYFLVWTTCAFILSFMHSRTLLTVNFKVVILLSESLLTLSILFDTTLISELHFALNYSPISTFFDSNLAIRLSDNFSFLYLISDFNFSIAEVKLQCILGTKPAVC